jgi:hypothetical protein
MHTGDPFAYFRCKVVVFYTSNPLAPVRRKGENEGNSRIDKTE